MTKRVPVLQAAANLTTMEVKKVQRRLAVVGPGESAKKDNMRVFMRVIGKLAHVGPFSTVGELIAQVSSPSPPPPPLPFSPKAASEPPFSFPSVLFQDTPAICKAPLHHAGLKNRGRSCMRKLRS